MSKKKAQARKLDGKGKVSHRTHDDFVPASTCIYLAVGNTVNVIQAEKAQHNGEQVDLWILRLDHLAFAAISSFFLAAYFDKQITFRVFANEYGYDNHGRYYGVVDYVDSPGV
jgi:hypothetical protein